MRLDFRPQLSGLIQNQREHRNLLDLVVDRQLEAIRQQSLHHQSILVLGRVAGSPRLDVIAIVERPFWRLLYEG